MQQNHEIDSKKCQSIALRGIKEHMEISFGLQKYDFVLLNKLRIVAHSIFRNCYQQIIKNKEKLVSLETSLQTHCYITILNLFHSNKNLSSYPAHRRNNLDFIFTGSEVTAQKTLRMPISLWHVESRHLTRLKRCGDFWLFGAESFPTNNMNDFFKQQ